MSNGSRCWCHYSRTLSSSLRNSFDGRDEILDEKYGYLIFKWDSLTWQRPGTTIVEPLMAVVETCAIVQQRKVYFLHWDKWRFVLAKWLIYDTKCDRARKGGRVRGVGAKMENCWTFASQRTCCNLLSTVKNLQYDSYILLVQKLHDISKLTLDCKNQICIYQ